MAVARRRRRAGRGSWGPHVQRKAVSGAAFCARDVGEDGVDEEMLQLWGDAAAARNSGELRGDGSLLHTTSKEKYLELRRGMRNGVERSEGWEVDGVDRKRGKSMAEWAAPASDWGGLGARWVWSWWGNRRGLAGV